ncbi:MAG: ribosomal-protein-alanine acetyltransferase [uncultured bacterium]|nr:MAG: ribosomal-protein-alanine acetyltransferase [uncultured bacterium]
MSPSLPSEQNYRIRKATDFDIPALIMIEQATQAAPWSEDVFKRCLTAGYDCWILEEKPHTLIGFIMLSMGSIHEAHILNLGIDPAFQGKGWGRCLLEHVLMDAKQQGIRMIYLEVRRSNQRAIHLYQQMGFVQVGERKNYYPAGLEREDALVLVKNI